MDDKILFLFELVPKNSRVIIYGLGNVGHSYIKQIETSNWCDIVAVIDRNKSIDNYRNCTINDINDLEYDYVIIAIESKKILHEVYKDLCSMNVDPSGILCMYSREDNFDISKLEQSGEVYNIAIYSGGGFGDALIDALLVKRIKEEVGSKANVYYFTKYVNFFEKFSFIDFSKNYNSEQANISKDNMNVVITMHNLALIEKFDERLKDISEALYTYCFVTESLLKSEFINQINNYRFTKYALLKGKNRIEQIDINGILGVSREDKMEIPLVETDSVLDKFNLHGLKYIAVNYDTEGHNCAHPKLISSKKFVDLISRIRNKYADYKIVLLGNSKCKEILDVVDYNLAGKTTLEEVAVILRKSQLLIACEGGLVHLNHFLEGKSLVFFGPTNPKVFGYKENANLVNEACTDYCEWLTDNWDKKCICGRAECINHVDDKVAFEAFESIMSNF